MHPRQYNYTMRTSIYNTVTISFFASYIQLPCALWLLFVCIMEATSLQSICQSNGMRQRVDEQPNNILHAWKKNQTFVIRHDLSRLLMQDKIKILQYNIQCKNSKWLPMACQRHVSIFYYSASIAVIIIGSAGIHVLCTIYECICV